MDFEFSDEQQQLHESIERYLKERYSFEKFRAIAASAQGWDEEVWRGLAELGWTGVCVEPSPPAFCELMRTYHGNPRVHLVNAAIAKQTRLATFHCNSEDGTHCDQVSTLDDKHLMKWGGFPFTKMMTPTLTYDVAPRAGRVD